MIKYLYLLLIVTQIYEVTNLPSQYNRSKETHAVIIHQMEPNAIPHLTRKKKGPTIPYQILVPNLHVIPISNVPHEVHTNLNVPQTVQHASNVTQQLIPVLIPFHNYVPVHDLTVIPLHIPNEHKVAYRANEEDDRFRNPLGGYGVGWTFGGHGSGHGFHYSYYG